MVRLALLWPLRSAPLKRHCKRNGGAPVAVTLKPAVVPLVTVEFCGGVTITGGSSALVAVVAVLFALTRSTSGLDTVTVLVMFPAARTCTTRVSVATAPLLIAPKEQVNTPALWLQLPWDGVADTKLTPDGNASLSVTLDATPGPALFTVIE